MRCRVLHLHHNKQSGLALITVLFIFALVSLMAVSMQQHQAMNIAQATSTFTQTQATQLVYTAEEFAKAGLLFDLNRDLNSGEWDSAHELWNQYFPEKFDNGTIEVNIRDLQGLFNLNWLHPTSPNQGLAIKRFQQLISNIEPGFSNPSSVATNLRDWFTPDSSANYVYQSKTPPYRAGEREMIHPSELKLVEGVTDALYEKLEPYITALPAAVQLNVNTTAPEILSAWDSGISSSDATTILSSTRSGSTCEQSRDTLRFKDVDEFMNHDVIKKLVGAGNNDTNNDESENGNNTGPRITNADFTVKTGYFSVLIRVTLDLDSDGTIDVDSTVESIIRRKQDSGNKDAYTGVIYRDFSRTVNDFSRLKIVNC